MVVFLVYQLYFKTRDGKILDETLKTKQKNL